jgi:hypothetical protein
MKLNILIITTLLSTSSFAAQKVKVIFVKGKVTALLPGTVEAINVKKSQLLPEDTSVVTGAKSIIRLKFADKSTMNLGPKSKVIVARMPVKKPNMINLLSGAMKAEVNKNSNKASKNKMIIKTRSAVMGVRGTKFQTSFNAKNGNTSLVTVEGNVAMVKRKQAPPKIIGKVVEEKSSDIETAQKVAEKIETIPESELDALDKALENTDEVVEVPAGRYSGVIEKSDKAPTAPTKIAPAQYKALAKSMNSKKKVEDIYTDKEIEKVANASNDVAALAPKSGGFVDFNTGLYVPPAKNAKKDDKTGVFVSKDLGKVNADTGDYIAPKGVILDAKKGFIVDQEEIAKISSTEDKAALQRTLSNIKSVNKEVKKQVKKQVVVNKMSTKSSSGKKSWWKPEQHILKASIAPYSETITAKNLSSNSEADFYSKEANITKFTWEHKWNEKWNSNIAVGFVTYEIDDQEVNLRDSDDNSDGYFNIGLSYNYTDRLNLNFGISDQAYTFVSPGNFNNEVNVQRTELNYLNLGARYFLWNWKAFEIYTGANLLLFNEKELPTFNSNEFQNVKSTGFRANIIGLYEWKDNMGIEAETFFERVNHETNNLEWTRLSLGTAAQFYWKI